MYPVPFPRRGFGGFNPQNTAPSPHKLKYETLYISGIFVKFECQAPLHERKAPLHKCKAHLLTTFWRRFCMYPFRISVDEHVPLMYAVDRQACPR